MLRVKKMKTTRITAGNKRHFESLIRDYRRDGWMLITYGNRLAELEKGDNMIVLTIAN
jgi:hypothetical protein